MISVIIPTYNEEGTIRATIKTIMEESAFLIEEIIVADGGSTDKTVDEARLTGAKVLISPIKGRSAQMNAGAASASGSIFYFLHADSIPPAGFTSDIIKAIENGNAAGCFRLAFDLNHWFLKFNCWFTRFDIDAFRYGDQSLFVTKDVFDQCGGFRVDYVVFEDNEIIKRLKRHSRFVILKHAVTTSARKYVDNGVFKTQFIFYFLFFLYRLGFRQHTLVKVFKVLIKQNKV